MIGYLNGQLLSFKENTVLLNVNCVGYEINCTSSATARLINERGGEVYVYTAVREDGIYLFGFDNTDEKEMFLKLIGVSGVGPKCALSILSSLGASVTRSCILSQDVKTLSSVKGLGKKTAEKIIVELRGGLPAGEVAQSVSSENEEAVQALISLGFDRNSATKAVCLAVENGAKTLEEVIANALRNVR